MSEAGSEAESIVSRALKGEAQAREELCRHYLPRLRGYFYANGLRGDVVDDAVQETLRRLLTALQEGRVRRNVGGWLFRVAQNLVADHYRAAAAQTPPIAAASPEAPDTVAARHEERARLWEMIRRLPATQREVLLIRFREGLKYRQTARRCGISENAVQLRLRRALETLRQMLGEP